MMTAQIPTQHFLIVAALLFSIGLAVAITKKNTIVILIGIELMLNAINLNLVAFSRSDTHLEGHFFALFVVVIAAIDTAVALAILLKIYREYKTIDIENLNRLKEPENV